MITEQEEREIAARAVEMVGDKLIGLINQEAIDMIAKKVRKGEIKIDRS